MTTLEVMRYELKYYISMSEYRILQSMLSSSMQHDKFSESGPYKVVSLYFDDNFDSAFYEKMDGVKLRKKLRVRIYNHSDEIIKFEIKNKIGDNIFKESFFITKKELSKILEGDCGFLLEKNTKAAQKAYLYLKSENFRPRTLIEYEREAFTCPFNQIRVTIDTNLRSRKNVENVFEETNSPIDLTEGTVILEVKYNYFLPDWIRTVLSNISTKRSAISKYCHGRMGEVL